MNGVAWVVQVQKVGKGNWVPVKILERRLRARLTAKALRQLGINTRVRRHLGQPEIRP